jgi:fibronectin-binding autotransporter adhesin
MKPKSTIRPYLAAIGASIIAISSASAQLQWDSNGATAGVTNAGGAWLGTNLWWNGSTNVDWTSGSDAIFGGTALDSDPSANTTGNAGNITLASPTAVGSITIGNAPGGAWGLGTNSVNLTVNSGVTHNGDRAATFNSEIVLGGAQTWTNSSSTLLSTANGRLLDNSGHQLTIEGTGNIQIGQINAATQTLRGSGALIKNGSGILLIGGNNSNQAAPTDRFTGNVTVNGGILFYGDNPGSLGTGNLHVTNGVVEARWNTGISRTQGTGAGEIQITGGESGFAGNGNTGVTFNIGAITWGSATFNPDKFILQNARSQGASSLTLSSAIDLNGFNRTIVTNGGTTGVATSTISGAITNGQAGAAGLIVEGNGTLILTAANTYNGGTTINGGTLRFTTLDSMPATGNVTVNDGTAIGVNLGTAATVWGAGTSGPGTLGGLLAGTGTSEQAVIYNGNVRLNLEVVAGVEFTGNIANVGTSLGLVKSGSGTLTLSGNNSYSGGTIIRSNLTLAGDNTTSGNTELVAGTLAIGHNNALGSGKLIISGGNFRAINGDRIIANAVDLTGTANPWDTNNIRINGNLTNSGGNRTLNNTMSEGAVLTLAGQVNLSESNTARTLTIGGTGDTLVSGNIVNGGTGAGGLTKSGASTLTLSGTNTYTGATTVSAGTLLINGNQSAATGNVAVNSTSTLGGSGTIGGAVTVAATANLAPGATVGTLTINNNLTISAMANGAGKLVYQLGPIAASDKIAVTGTLNIGTDVLGFSDFDFSNLGGLEEGVYTLITSGGISGSLDEADLEGTIGTTAGTLGISGNNITLTIGEPGGTPYELWSGGAAFNADTNGDGVENGLAWLLGAANPNVSALGLLPSATQGGGGLTLTFSMLNSATRGTASLQVQHSADLGIADPWTSVTVPDISGGPTSGVTFTVAPNPQDSGLNDVTVTISSNEANAGKLFARLKAENP